MTTSYYVLRPLSGGSKATSVDMTGSNSKKITQMWGNPASDSGSGVLANNGSPMSGTVPAGG